MESEWNTSHAICSKAEQNIESALTEKAIGQSQNTRDVVKELQKAFEDEKQENVKWRQKVPSVIATVNDVMKEVRVIKEEINAAKNARHSINEHCESSYMELSKRLDQSVMLFSSQLREMEHKFRLHEILLKHLDTKSFENKTLSPINSSNENSRTLQGTVASAAQTSVKPTSCQALFTTGTKDSGVYDIYLMEINHSVSVYCDMTTDGGGWTVFQRRQDGSVDFYRDWADYKKGFGNITGEFWLGNDNIAALTSHCCHELRIELFDFYGKNRYATYRTFQVKPEANNYKIDVGWYSGDAGNPFRLANKAKFSTRDRDKDERSPGSCARRHKGGWWYKNCHLANLNGVYYKRNKNKDNKRKTRDGIKWQTWQMSPLKKTLMMLR